MKKNHLSSGAKLLFLLAPVLAPLTFTWLTQESFYIPKRFILEALFILSFILFVWAVVWSDESPLKPFLASLPVVFWPIVIFLLWSGLSLSRATAVHSVHSYSLLFSQAGVGMLALILTRDAKLRLLLVRLCVATASAVALLGVAQYFGLDYEHGVEWVPGGHLEKLDVYSTSGNPNFLAAYLISVFPLALVGMFSKAGQDGRWRWMYVAASAVIGLCLIYTRTKGAWIGAACSILFLLFMMKPALPRRANAASLWLLAGAGFVVILGALFASGTIAWIIEEMRSLQSSNVTIRGRLFLWQVTLGMIFDHPLMGVGWGNYRSFFQEYQGRFLDRHPDYVTLLQTQGSAESPHNEYLEIAAETGIVGLVLFLIIMAAIFRVACRIKRSDANVNGILTAAISGVLALLVHSFFVFPLHLADAGMMFWLLVGMIGGAGFGSDKAVVACGACRRAPATAMKVAINASVLAVAILVLWWAFKPVMASVYHKRAWEAMYLGNYPVAVQMAEKGITWSRDNDELYLISGAAKYQMGLVRASIEDYRMAYEIFPDYMTIYNTGLAYQQLGMSDEAARCFERVIFIRPNLRDAYLQLLAIASYRGDEATVARVKERMQRMKVPAA